MSDSTQSICNLSPEELTKRKQVLRDEVMSQLLQTEALANGRAWDFSATQEMEERLERLVEFERNCCGGLEWSVEQRAQTLRLQVLGIDPDHPLLVAEPLEDSTGLARVAKAGGIGLGLSFFAFCVVPIAAVALFGTATAAWLARLDDPRIIAAGTFALGLPVWFLLRRRRRSPAS